MIVPALANLEDIMRLEKLEREGLMPVGTVTMAAKQVMAYMFRIGQLIESSHGQRQPVVS